MNAKKNISSFQRIFVFAFAFILLVGSVSTSFTDERENVEIVKTEKSTQKKEQNENESTQGTTSVTALQAIIQFVHIDLHFTSYLIQEIKLISVQVHYPEVDQLNNSTTSYFITLFRRIISPNAP